MKTPTTVAVDPWTAVPTMLDGIIDRIDDVDLATSEIRQLGRLALDQCLIVEGSDAIESLIRAILRYVDDVGNINVWLHDTVPVHANKLKAAGMPWIDGGT